MSVSCDKFVGFCIDIKEEFDKLTDEEKDFWSADFGEKHTEEYNAINFIPYYNRIGSLKNKVTIINDGMCGEYTYLMYVIDYDIYSEFEDCEHLVDSINSLLEDSGIDFDIKSQIKTVYKTMFNKEMTLTSSIKAKYIIHYH